MTDSIKVECISTTNSTTRIVGGEDQPSTKDLSLAITRNKSKGLIFKGIHGWLQCTECDLRNLGILSKLTSKNNYSYQPTNMRDGTPYGVRLHYLYDGGINGYESSDFALFMNAFKEKFGVEPTTDELSDECIPIEIHEWFD